MAWYDSHDGANTPYGNMTPEELAALYAAALRIYEEATGYGPTPVGTVGIPTPTVAPAVPTVAPVVPTVAPVMPTQGRTYPTMDRSADGPSAAPTAPSTGSYAPPMSDAESQFIRRYATAVNTRSAPAVPTAPVAPPVRGGTYDEGGNPSLEQVGSNSFEARLAATDRAKKVSGNIATDYVPDTGGLTTEQALATVYASLGLNPDGSPRGGGGGGGGGTTQVVLSPEQIRSLVDGLGQQTMMAQQGVGQAYDQANREMAQLMRQYSRAEKMNRAGTQGTLSAFGAPKSAYKVGDFGAPEMLAGARANLIGGKAAEMSNWSNQQALYKQLLKDMGG